MTRIEELLRQAVTEKRPISAVYESRKRLMCPHVLGWKSGKLNVLCYQYAGESSSGPVTTPPDPNNGPPNLWRCLNAESLQELQLLEPGPWYTCQKHSQAQTCVDIVIVEVPKV